MNLFVRLSINLLHPIYLRSIEIRTLIFMVDFF